MGKWTNYHWIPPSDHSINSREFYRSEVVEATLSKDGRFIVMKTYIPFPVGSIFHSLHGDVDYVIHSKDKHSYEYIYNVLRCDNEPVGMNDVLELKMRRWIFRDGFIYGV